MILGTGIDLVEVERIHRLWDRFGARFSNRILHLDELSQQPSDTQNMGRWLAKRWATKEAASKALGTGFQQGVSFSDFAVHHDTLGKPYLHISGKASEIAKQRHINAWHLSISDEKNLVIAMVIAENVH